MLKNYGGITQEEFDEMREKVFGIKTKQGRKMKRAKATIINPVVSRATAKFSFEIQLENVGDELIYMGNSSFVFETSAGGTMRNPRLETMNAQFDSVATKNPMYYAPILTQFAGGRKLILQIRHRQGEGYAILPKSILAKIEMDINPEIAVLLDWHEADCAVVEPNYNTVPTGWFGNYIE